MVNTAKSATARHKAPSPGPEPAAAAKLPDGENDGLGTQLRRLRGERNVTILELAAKAGVSAGIISQIERGNSNPSIKTLQRLGAALDVNIWELLDDPRRGAAEDLSAFVRRRDQRPRMVLGDGGLSKELLSPHYAESLRFMFISMQPGSATVEVLIGPGQKAGYVVSGAVELTVGGRVVDLQEGDSFQFGSDVHHGLANRSAEDAKILWIMSAVEKQM